MCHLRANKDLPIPETKNTPSSRSVVRINDTDSRELISCRRSKAVLNDSPGKKHLDKNDEYGGADCSLVFARYIFGSCNHLAVLVGKESFSRIKVMSVIPPSLSALQVCCS